MLGGCHGVAIHFMGLLLWHWYKVAKMCMLLVCCYVGVAKLLLWCFGWLLSGDVLNGCHRVAMWLLHFAWVFCVVARALV